MQADGIRSRWTAVTYELSTGEEAEAFVEVDEHGRGEALLYMEGEPIMRATTDGDTWWAPDIELPPEMLAELVSRGVADEVFLGLSHDALAGKCSNLEYAVVKGVKILWIVAAGAAGVACCSSVGGPSLGAGCIICGGLAAAAVDAGAEAADGYCS
jgi:hypothetical protein